MELSPTGALREQRWGVVFTVRAAWRTPCGLQFGVPGAFMCGRRTHVERWRRSVLSVGDEKDRVMGTVAGSGEESGVVPQQGSAAPAESSGRHSAGNPRAEAWNHLWFPMGRVGRVGSRQ